MEIILIKSQRLYNYPFPTINIGEYWVNDFDENEIERNLVCLKRNGNDLYIESNENCEVFDLNNKIDKEILVINKFYLLKIRNNNKLSQAFLYVCEQNDPNYVVYEFTNDGEYSIGSSESSSIVLNNDYVKPEHAILKRSNGLCYANPIDTQYGIYLNNERVINSDEHINNGDILFIMGYKIIILGNYLIINNNNDSVIVNSPLLQKSSLPTYDEELIQSVEDDNAVLFTEQDYFSRSPRFVTSIDEEDIVISPPPGKNIKEENSSLLMTIGPTITMGMSSLVTGFTAVNNVVNKDYSFVQALPSLLICTAMLVSTFVWPTLSRKISKKNAKEGEEKRQRKYIEYLIEKRRKIENLKVSQRQILLENFPEPKDCATIIVNKKRNLWERLRTDNDFLNVRVGTGNIPLKIKLSYSSEDFTMSEDNLKDELNKLVESSKEVKNAPVTISLTERNKLVIIGETLYKEMILKSILLQLVTNQSYDDLKLVFMINDSTSDMWQSFKILPHTWSNTRDIRFYANNYDDITKLSFYLEQVFTSRKYTENDGKTTESGNDYRNVKPYYLIIVDNIKKNKNIEIINKILKENKNIGFGLIILNDGISNLPNECSDFLMASGEKSAIVQNDLNKDNQQAFVMDTMGSVDFPLVCEKLSNIPIKVPLALDELKNSISFLEMYKVGKVEQLNVLDRWIQNNPVNSLSVPIGIHADQELFTLDLHEKFHGPHGLIAGMTGSGKSEFIITYILSMCLNFEPREVSFVLIDYKGGGLTGAFENKLTGIKLPHLAGTITNLDAAEIKRSLASIQSELKRRQELFNKAKLDLNESTLDIYKYQKLFRDGLIKTPISHLFIISDEFAELKTQQPEFMDQLISTARIGRSLGVHLILATQKPSGIVDDQIWSNSKFKVCLKVQEKSDSMDVIKCPDAAALKKAGRFYLQVGYNDYFATGQAAWAGAMYIPKDKISKTVDRNLSFINNIGDIVKSVETVNRKETVTMGEELPNILKYICASAESKGLVAEKLWLDKIPAEIYVSDLISKYRFTFKKWDIRPIIGEYDDPNNQRQGILTLNFNNTGNTLIYGASGSGKEIMLSTIIFSLIISHTSEEINFYIIDFGSETFGMFKSAPQVGDVVYVSEDEKIINLFNMLDSILDNRKKQFVNFNGDFNLYNKENNKKEARIIVIINNYETFNESFEDFVDRVSSLSREGERYGIMFIITASGVNAVRGKTSQNFSQQLCLQFNDPTDYSSIYGSTHGMVPSEIIGRGLYRTNGELYEYQTAYPYSWNSINSFIKNICVKLSQNMTYRAPEIAILPEHVRLKNVERYINTLKDVPIGIEKDSLRVSTFDFLKNPISLISAQDSSAYDKFIPSLIQVLNKINNFDLYIFDASENIQNHSEYKNYFSTNFLEAYNVLNTIYNSLDESKTHLFLMYGFDAFKNGLSATDQKQFLKLLSNLKNKKNIHVVIIDGVSRIKAYEYEEFYRSSVQPTYALWIGSGISDQFTIKSSTYNKITRSLLEPEFGFSVNKGTAILIKILDFYSND